MQSRIYCRAMRGKTYWDPKRERHVKDAPKQGYLAKAVRSFYVNLKDVLSNSEEMKNACKVGKSCYGKLDNGDFEDGVSRKTFRSLGGGRKTRAVEFFDNPKKVPAPDRIEMMTLLKDAIQDVRINENSAFKSVWVTNALDGSEDYLVSDKIFSLVGESM